MKKFKNILKSFLIFIIPILISVFVFSTLNYFNIIGYKTLYIIIFIISLISSFLSGFYMGKHSDNKGLIRGMVVGLINSLFLLRTLSLNCFTSSLASISGGILGINKKK